MQISKEADYALRAVLYLSRQEDARHVATSKIATSQRIPPSFLAKIVSRLSSAGIFRTSRGARGGVSLARPADGISVLEVIEVIDGPVTLNECVLSPESCPFGQTCSLQSIFCEAQAALTNHLRQTSFAQVA